MVIQHRWRPGSSATSTFSTASLSPGTHTISLRVRDDDGAWSTPVTSSLTVTDGSTQVSSPWRPPTRRTSTVVAPSTTTTAMTGWEGAAPVSYGQSTGGISQVLTPPGTLPLLRYGSIQKPRQDPLGPSLLPAMAPPTVRTTPRPIPVHPHTARSMVPPMHPCRNLLQGPGRDWINLGSTAALISSGAGTMQKQLWSVGLKASSTVESSTTVRHVDFSEDNEANDAELRITYTAGSPPLPTVTVSATDSAAAENPPDTGTFTVSRTGSTTTALTVYYTVSGTATTGSDYTALPGSVTIPAGSSSATITVTPINDTTVENPEAVVVTVSANANYTVGSPSSATVTITSDDGGGSTQLTLESTYSTDVKNTGTKYYHDGNDWVGRSSSGILRAVNRWDISSIDPSWNITSVEVRFYTEAKTGSPGALSLNRYGTSHGEDNPQTDAGASAYSKINGTPYASLPEPSSGSWTRLDKPRKHRSL